MLLDFHALFLQLNKVDCLTKTSVLAVTVENVLHQRCKHNFANFHLKIFAVATVGQ